MIPADYDNYPKLKEAVSIAKSSLSDKEFTARWFAVKAAHRKYLDDFAIKGCSPGDDDAILARTMLPKKPK
jgi:hypothetical protein